MKISDIRKEVTEKELDYTVRLSCMSYDYTKDHLNETESFYVLSDRYGNLSLSIDWEDTMKMTVRELLEYPTDLEVTSYDNDDMVDVVLHDLIIDHNLKMLVLVWHYVTASVRTNWHKLLIVL